MENVKKEGVVSYESEEKRSCEKTQNRFSITFFVVILKFFVVILNLIQNLFRGVKR